MKNSAEPVATNDINSDEQFVAVTQVWLVHFRRCYKKNKEEHQFEEIPESSLESKDCYALHCLRLTSRLCVSFFVGESEKVAGHVPTSEGMTTTSKDFIRKLNHLACAYAFPISYRRLSKAT